MTNHIEDQDVDGIPGEWWAAPAGLVGVLREVLDRRLPDGGAHTDMGALALELAATAQQWHR